MKKDRDAALLKASEQEKLIKSQAKEIEALKTILNKIYNNLNDIQ